MLIESVLFEAAILVAELEMSIEGGDALKYGCFDDVRLSVALPRIAELLLTVLTSAGTTNSGSHPDDLAVSNGSRNEALVFNLFTFYNRVHSALCYKPKVKI